ncbi:MAG: acyltransferase family protein [Acidimicrobiales bacterium]
MQTNGWRYRAELDGLRALAALAVVGHHAGFPLLGGGRYGVDLFFVLSGFLITSLLRRELAETGRIRLGRFLLRRLARLYPALALMLVVTAGLFAVLRPEGWRDSLVGAALAAGYLSSAALAAGAQLGSYSHTWSLAVEECFYLAWPLALLLLARRFRTEGSLARAVFALLAAAVAYRWGIAWLAGGRDLWVYSGADARAEQLLVGSALAVASPRAFAALARLGPPAALALTLAAVAPLSLSESVVHRGGSTFVATAAAAVVAWAVVRPQRLLAHPLLVWLGRRSYGLYLWHFALFGLFIDEATTPRQAVTTAAAGVLSLGAAAASYRWWETPCRDRLNRLVDRASSPLWVEPSRVEISLVEPGLVAQRNELSVEAGQAGQQAVRAG